MNFPWESKTFATRAWMVEELEARVAPATLFAHADGTLADGKGTAYVQFDEPAATAAGADALYLFHPGDKLIIDANGNNKADRGEETLLAVKGGAAAVFFKNLQDGGTTWDIAGIAAGDKFGGVINADVHGDIITMLSTSQVSADFNAHTAALEWADISGLTINGHVDGNIIAGGNISGLKITDFNPVNHRAVSQLLTGTTADGASVHFANGLATLQLRPPVDGNDGGSISNVSITGGVGNIAAGNGTASLTGAGGDGGSVKGIHLFDQTANDHLLIYAGDGGDGVKGGGAGGTISQVTAQGDSLGSGGFYAGDGGDGHSELAGQPVKGATGGKGGMISNLNLTTWASAVQLIGGDGGDGSGAGKGGIGGSVHGAGVTLNLNGAVNPLAGNGGSSDAGDAKDGSLTGVKINNQSVSNDNLTSGSTIVYTGGATFAGGTPTINGTPGLTKDGGGSLVLSGSNGYMGGTTITSGELVLGSGGSTLGGDLTGLGAFITANGTGMIKFSGSSPLISGLLAEDILAGNDLTFGESVYTFVSHDDQAGNYLYANASGGRLSFTDEYVASLSS